MRGGRGRAVAAATAIAAGLGYTAQVEYFARKARQEAPQSFGPNSGDEVLKNGLATGDLVFFSRRWYRYHLPEALSIKLRQVLSGGSVFDHVGVVVADKYGVPHVFENTFFQGCKLRPFEDRVLQSKAHQVLVLPLLPRNVQHDAQGQLAQHARTCAEQKSQRYHPFTLLSDAPNIVRDCYEKMGIHVQGDSSSNQQLLDRACQLSRADAASAAPLKFGPLVVARTR